MSKKEPCEIQKLKDEILELKEHINQMSRKPTKGSKMALEAKIVNLTREKSRLQRELRSAHFDFGIFNAIVEELESVIVPLDEPERYVDPRPQDHLIEEHLVMHLSDEHADEVVEPHMVGGLEKFDFEVALCRAELYVETILSWVRDCMKTHRFPVLHILSYGDHTSGEIHGSDNHSQYKNMFRNSLAIGQMQALMIHDLAPYFKKVAVYCVPGNHGRRSKKKNHHGAWDNWDYLISEIARINCQNLKNVEFLIPNSFSMNIDINGWGFGVEHGDGIKSWMGIPWYGIERKTRRLVSLHNSTGKQIQYFVFGHFHSMSTTADLRGETIINGAWPATNPYSYNEFSGYREPMQLIHGVHKAKGITWRLPIKLKDVKREALGPQRYKIDLSPDLAGEFTGGLDNSFPGGGSKLT